MQNVVTTAKLATFGVGYIFPNGYEVIVVISSIEHSPIIVAIEPDDDNEDATPSRRSTQYVTAFVADFQTAPTEWTSGHYFSEDRPENWHVAYHRALGDAFARATKAADR